MSAFMPDAPAHSPDNDHDVDSPNASERLAASRERMRQWMLHADGRQDARRRVEAAREAGDRPAWLDRLRTTPLIGLIIDAASAWWANHPVQPAATLAHDVLRDKVAPVARRHPFLIVTGAFLIGLAIARWRPWRLLKPALFAGLGSHILTRVIASVPLETVVEVIGSFGKRPPREDGDAPSAPSPPPVPDAAVDARTVTP